MEKDIGKISKNDITDIIVRLDDFGGKIGLTIREFITSDRYTGFTKAGVRIPVADFLKFREMINSVSLEDLKEEAKEEAEKTEKKPEKNQRTLSEKIRTEKVEDEEAETLDEEAEDIPDY